LKSVRIKLLLAVATAGALVAVGTVASAGNGNNFRGHLTGYQEVPALSTTGAGEFHAKLDSSGESMTYELTFGSTETTVTQSHIHFENATNNGPVVVFLCTNLNNSPTPVQACPASGTITGTITSGSVIGVAGGAAVGLDSGEFQELVNAMRAGATYVNVHSTGRPGGEIRAQLSD
jgi:hypothetical protein